MSIGTGLLAFDFSSVFLYIPGGRGLDIDLVKRVTMLVLSLRVSMILIPALRYARRHDYRRG